MKVSSPNKNSLKNVHKVEAYFFIILQESLRLPIFIRFHTDPFTYIDSIMCESVSNEKTVLGNENFEI